MAFITFNADDFGITVGVTKGIVQAMTNGVVTSTSAMACVDNAEKNILQYLNQCPGSIGAHLQLTGGKPVLSPEKIPSLVNKNGYFFDKSAELPWHIDPNELYEEWKAQVVKLQEWGIQPSYLDSHHHVHLQGHLLPTFARLARELNLPARAGKAPTCRQLRYLGVSCPDITVMGLSGEQLSLEHLIPTFKHLLASNGSDMVLEVCCHPGFSSPELEAVSFYTDSRETELQHLTRPHAKEQLNEIGFHLIGMNELIKLRPPKTIN